MDKLFLAFLVKTLNVTTEEAASLLYKTGENGEVTEELNDNALALLLEKDASRVTTLKASVNTQQYFDNGYKKAQKEVLSSLEQNLKEEYGVDSDSTGIELVKEIVSKNSKGSKGKDITDEDIKKHPLYLKIEASKNKMLDEIKEEYESKMNDMKSEFTRTQNYQTVKNSARSILGSMNPIVSNNDVIARNREADFLSKLEKYDYQIGDDGMTLVLNKETGERMEDPHGNPFKFEDIVKEEAALYYDFKAQNDKGSAGNEKGSGGGSGVQVPKSETEYYEMIADAQDAEARAEITAAWEGAEK